MATSSVIEKLPLHSAAKENDLVKLKQLLLDGNSHTVNLRDQRGRTPLHCLLDSPAFTDLDEVKRGIQILLDNGADINIQNKHGETPLHTVVQIYLEFIPEIIRYVLTHSQSYVMEAQDEDGYSLFHLFMSDFSDHVKENKIYHQILKEKEEFIQALLRGEILKFNFSALLNQKERNGYSAFYTYIGNSTCATDTVQLMISCGADVNTSSEIGTTPLMESVLRRRRDIVEILLKAGANPNQTDIFGQSCIFRVYTNDCFDLLNQYGANFKIKDKFGRSPITNVELYISEDLPHSNIVLSQNFSKYPPLYEKFLEVGMNSNEVDKHGSSLLHYGAWHGDSRMIKALIEHGSDLNILDNSGNTPLDLAKHVRNENVYSLFGETNEEVNQNNNETKYCRFIINEAETNKMETVLNEYLGINDDPACLVMSLVKSPRLGMTEIRPEVREIKAEVTCLMQRIASVVGRLNPLFSCTVYPTGSSSEGTKVGDPDEFDFVFCLEEFSKYCVPHQDDDILNSGFVSLKIQSGEGMEKFEAFLDESTLSAELDRGTFQDLITSALNTPDIWTSKHLYFDGLLGYPMDKPVLKLELHWFGPIMKHVRVSVDIVPAVEIKHWKPIELTDKKVACSIEDQYLLLFHSPERCQWDDKDDEHLVRISSSLMEKCFLKSLPKICTESYATAKILKSINFPPKVQFNEEVDMEKITTSELRLLQQTDSTSTSELEGQHKKEKENNVSDNDYDNEGMQNKQPSNQVLTVQVSQDISNAEEQSVSIVNKAQTFDNNPVLPWMMDIDETYKVRKIFTPKENNKSKKKVYLDEQMGMTCTTSVFEKDRHKLICFKPMECGQDSNNLNNHVIQSEEKQVGGQSTYSLNTEQDRDLKLDLGFPDKNIGKNIDRNGSTEDNTNDSIKSTNDNTDEEDVDSEEGSEDMEDDSSCETEWEGGDVAYASDEISSYMLKMCLFHVVHEVKNKTGDMPTFTLLELTIKIYEKLLTFAKEGRLPSFFLPFLDVFTYVNTYIKVIPEEDLETLTKQQCSRIQAFCKVILGILKQNRAGEVTLYHR
ncbi:uncharacterized protein LOC133195176 [Saccostrea echinata]|uniref:uncharacterized protein LOC133195176 n=1 Tax=Saccostrea echinata TaxID=191078 RepID=UPI002A80CBD8|nr:uncharacterized protein LOC133195176 [Saccostrea echinata]